MASNTKSSAKPTERPPAEQVARENYKQQFGTTKVDASLPAADADFDASAEMGAAVEPSKKESSE